MTTVSTVKAQEFRPLPSVPELIAQIGRMNIFGISGGRVEPIEVEGEVVGVKLPVGSGYSVEVLYAWDDTYTVRRVFTRSGVAKTKGEATEVYCTEVGETAYTAGMFRSYDFGAHKL